MTLTELKEKCKKVRAFINTKSWEKGSQMIREDLNNLTREMPVRLKRIDTNHFILDEKISIAIDEKDHILRIEDRRGLAYGWSFEIVVSDIDGVIPCGDAFEVEKRTYSVEMLNEQEYKDVKKAADNVLKTLEEAENRISHRTISELTYSLYSNYKEEEHLCHDLESMFDVICKRDYTMGGKY